MRLRQLVLVADDLRPVEQAITAGLDVEVCYRDPGVGHFGLRHGLYTIGDRLLEVVAPKQPGTTAGRYLERRGAGGYMVIVQVDDLAAHRARILETDTRIVFDAKAPGINGIHLHPADVGGAILSTELSDPPRRTASTARRISSQRPRLCARLWRKSSESVRICELSTSVMQRNVARGGRWPTDGCGKPITRCLVSESSRSPIGV